MPFGIADRLDDALRLFDALVGDHGNRVRQLERIGRIRLAEQHGVLGSQIPLIGRIQQTIRFAGKTKPIVLSDTEFADELISLLVRHLLRGDDHADIRRLLENACQRPMLIAVGRRIAVGLPVRRNVVRHREFIRCLVQSKLNHA